MRLQVMSEAEYREYKRKRRAQSMAFKQLKALQHAAIETPSQLPDAEHEM